MQEKKNYLSDSINTILWGNSVALAWTWGIGLFFSVQVAIQFGFDALFKFATIDAIGLTLFGVVNQYIARKFENPEAYELSFLDKAKNFKFGFLFYQFLAVTLTLFCCMKYVTLPLGVLSILVAGAFIGVSIFLGEEFSIERIKYSHAVYGLMIFTSMLVLLNSNLFNLGSLFTAELSASSNSVTAQLAFNNGIFAWIEQARAWEPLYKFHNGFADYAFWIPVLLGFLCGPWLDLQNWQRAIQIRKEGNSITTSYIFAGLIFWSIVMLNGMVALSCFQHAKNFLPEIISTLSNYDPASILYSVKTIITKVLFAEPAFKQLLGFYLILIGFSALSTFDSAYIGYKWYLESLMKDAKSLIFTFISTRFLSSPIPWLFASMVTAMVSLHFAEIGKFIAIFDDRFRMFFSFELEYYMAFYATFFIIYAVTFYRNMQDADHEKSFSALKLFSTALSSIAIFGIGYFGNITTVMALGSLVPFIYGWFTLTKESDYKAMAVEEDTKLLPENRNSIPVGDFKAEEIQSVELSSLPPGAKPVNIKGCYMQGNWFVHQFIPTYQDTNSVGNVYFAMYLMWVGKTRELFFAHCMPEFDPKTSDFFILTRNIEHKFVREIKEFDEASIQIKIGNYNRKFVTLEHKILTKEGAVVGKGKQSLMFVESKNYGLIDLPVDVQKAFIPFADTVEDFIEV